MPPFWKKKPIWGEKKNCRISSPFRKKPKTQFKGSLPWAQKKWNKLPPNNISGIEPENDCRGGETQ